MEEEIICNRHRDLADVPVVHQLMVLPVKISLFLKVDPGTAPSFSPSQCLCPGMVLRVEGKKAMERWTVNHRQAWP